MRYSYDITDYRGNKVYENLSSKQEAQEVISFLQSQGINTSTYQIVENQHYTVKGLGRDPDLH